jgi:3-oxoacyl-[acyl-carrier-protein] synthase II
MQAALDDAKLPASAIAYINAHGTATEVGDVTETHSIRQVFGAHAERLAISSTKSMHGHLIGAAGALEFALSLLAMRHKILPPTANLLEADPRCDLDYVACHARPVAEINAVMSNSFAFGGSNVALIARQARA